MIILKIVCVVRLVVKSIFFFIIYDNDVCGVINLEKKCIYGLGGGGLGVWCIIWCIFMYMNVSCIYCK